MAYVTISSLPIWGDLEVPPPSVLPVVLHGTMFLCRDGPAKSVEISVSAASGQLYQASPAATTARQGAAVALSKQSLGCLAGGPFLKN